MGVRRSPRWAHSVTACASASALQRAWSWSGAGKTVAIGVVLASGEALIKARLGRADGILIGLASVFRRTYIAVQQFAAGRREPPTRISAMLKGKSAVVTGSTSGIGLAIAKALAQAGANVTINGFGDKAAIEAERAGIEKAFGVKASYAPADMTKPAEIADMIRTAEKTYGAVDILVNNAGIQHVAPTEEFPIEKWDQIIAINLSAAFLAIRAAIPGMKARKWGRIVSTASAHSLVASPFKAAYVTAKHGLTGLTKTVALEVATLGITANCISPGYVWTPLVESQIPDTMKARGMTREQVINDVVLVAQPTKQFVTPEQVASLVIYLCSDAASQITGANLSIDGGWTAQ